MKKIIVRTLVVVSVLLNVLLGCVILDDVVEDYASLQADWDIYDKQKEYPGELIKCLDFERSGFLKYQYKIHYRIDQTEFGNDIHEVSVIDMISNNIF